MILGKGFNGLVRVPAIQKGILRPVVVAEHDKVPQRMGQLRGEALHEIPARDQVIQPQQEVLPDDDGVRQLTFLQRRLRHEMPHILKIEKVVDDRAQKPPDIQIQILKGLDILVLHLRIAGLGHQRQHNVRFLGVVIGEIPHTDPQFLCDIPHGHGVVALLIKELFRRL